MGKIASPSLRIRFGRRVRAIRLRQDLSLENLAERSGLNDKFIQAVETARQSPTIDTVEKLALGLGIDLRELFTFEDESPEVLRKHATRLIQTAEDENLARIVRLLQSALY